MPSLPLFAAPRAAVLALTLASAWLAGCTTAPPAAPAAEAPPLASTPWATASGDRDPTHPHWEHYALPGKQPSEFRYVRLDGRDTLAVQSDAAASMVRQKVRVEPDALGQLQFSWKVPSLIAGTDLAERDRDDTPVRVVLAFEGDRSKWSARNAMLSELARAITGEEMPYATLMYVWCNKRPVGTVLQSPRTDRIRKIVVESGADHLGTWQDYARNVRADFERVFGEPPGPLVGIAIMTDTDNTRTRTRAWYGPVRLVSGLPAQP